MCLSSSYLRVVNISNHFVNRCATFHGLVSLGDEKAPRGRSSTWFHLDPECDVLWRGVIRKVADEKARRGGG